ncbi:Asp-tRNA(Asn)/Glu-tRNA(Gln) amidotransferase subunit GatC [bacterium]|nr:Asp-tRNA(Asn)/Glu-tRNA(Gln) amidotransferase subunit GatC [bacterium]
MLSLDDVKKIALLSRLKLSDSELEKFSRELSDILQYVDKLNELKLDNIQATSHAVAMTNVFRDDIVVEAGIGETVFKVAPQAEDNLFVVPKVI